ncbi:MAG TPA: hypothetical protein VN038_22365, partial [Dyadobacter sp.]|nr:hypothetical protein [Dyadobacter sp.]
TNLDRILKAYPKYGQFAQKFVQKRLGFKPPKTGNAFDPHRCFDEVNSEEYYGHSFDVVGIDPNDTNYLRAFSNALKEAPRKLSANDVKSITETLTEGVPLILRKLNALRFCKQYSNAKSPLRVAQKIKDECLVFMQGRSLKSSYANAYGHYKNDLFAQLCRDSKKARGGVPYAGFETFITMSSGNPRNLLIILGKAYEIAAFRELDFINGSPLSIALQTEAAIEAAHFMYERDTNYGSESDLARGATERLALVLRTARYALNIPEVSPLAVSFSEEELSPNARAVLNYALNYSLVFEVYDGRPDRNSQRVQKKIQLNPLLSPKWGLPIGRRGDISLSAALVNAIFDSTKQGDFNILLNALDLKWNHPFGVSSNLTQVDLF